MKQVLSIDLSSNIIQAAVCRVAAGRVEIVVRGSIDSEGAFSESFLLNSLAVSKVNTGSEQEQDRDNIHLSKLKSLLDKVSGESWESVVFVIPPICYSSLNLSLPFSDSKRLDKIVPLEVQDLLPFDLQEFAITHHPITQSTDGKFDIHVGFIPKIIISNLLILSKEIGLEPSLITTSGAALGGLYLLAKDYLLQDSGIVLARGDYIYFLTAIGGLVRYDRVIRIPLDTDPVNSVLTQVKLSIAQTERLYGVQLTKVYLVGDDLASLDLQRALGRSVEVLRSIEFIGEDQTEGLVAALAAVYADEHSRKDLIVNFRSGEFAYDPEMKLVLGGLKEISPYALVSLTLLLLGLLVVYIARYSQILSMKNGIRSQVVNLLNDQNIVKGEELPKLQNSLLTIEEQLEGLATGSRYMPLDALVALSSDITDEGGIDVTSLSIKGNKIVLEGFSPGYAPLEKLEKDLKKRKDIYCRVTKDATTSTGMGDRRRFTLEIRLCE